MSDTEYDHNGIIKLNADGDKGTSLSIGVYQGYASLAVFSNKASVAKFSLPRPLLTEFANIITGLITAPPGTKFDTHFTKYDMESKKQTALGSLFIGRDDKSIIYFGIKAPNHPAMKFPFRTPLSFDRSEPMSDVDRSIMAARGIIAQLTIDIPYAMMLTSKKRDRTGGGYGGGRSSNNTSGDIF